MQPVSDPVSIYWLILNIRWLFILLADFTWDKIIFSLINVKMLSQSWTGRETLFAEHFRYKTM